MKRLFIFLAAALMTVNVMAEIYPTKFLGIPIDGTKQEMIQKIQAKGFTLHKAYGEEYLSGEFNGSQVHIYVATNNNKVYRVMVAEQVLCSAGQIRIRFNNLLQQFIDNQKYLTSSMGQDPIPSDEDISYEMTVKDKIYDARFVQMTHDIDTVLLKEDAAHVIENIGQDVSSSLLSSLDPTTLATYCTMIAVIKQFEKNQVWFRIDEFGSKYYLTIYYDNLYNKANGEDL